MTLALREILEQPISFRAEGGFGRGQAQVTFSAERDGNKEDILDGQGGSVANILSVGLRMFALASLDETRHRRVLVLTGADADDREQLCNEDKTVAMMTGASGGADGVGKTRHELVAADDL